MADTPKVVEGTEVKFEGGVSQPDALSPPAEPVIQSPETTPSMDPEVYQALHDYLSNVAEQVKTARGLTQPPWPQLPPITPYLRFQSDMSVTAVPVPKTLFISFIEKENKTLANLLTTTDLGEELPDLCTIDELPEVVKAFGYHNDSLEVGKQLSDLLTTTKSRLDIPGGYFVSLLIPGGETYRKYLEHGGPQSSPNYIWGEKKNPIIRGRAPFISPVALELFVRETGESHVAGFVKDLQSLDNELRGLKSAGAPASLINALYVRLKQYHPELTI